MQVKQEVAKLTNQIEYEQERQKEIEELKGKVNTDEYIEKMAERKTWFNKEQR